MLKKAGDNTDSEGGCSPPEPSSVALQERIEMLVEVNDGPFGFLLAPAPDLQQRVQASQFDNKSLYVFQICGIIVPKYWWPLVVTPYRIIIQGFFEHDDQGFGLPDDFHPVDDCALFLFGGRPAWLTCFAVWSGRVQPFFRLSGSTSGRATGNGPADSPTGVSTIRLETDVDDDRPRASRLRATGAPAAASIAARVSRSGSSPEGSGR
jgi:hypothetical protein